MSKKTDPWMSISDMMTTLMMIFLFVSISYMLDVSKKKNRIEQVAVTYNILQNDLYADLMKEFESDLSKWNAMIDRETLSLRFEEPDILFAVGCSDLKPAFKDILDDFFPRYVRIITRAKYQNDIEEIRIEGHTSSEWNGVTDENGYFQNMKLSQDRTRAVLEYVLSSPSVVSVRKEWVRDRLTANGLSSSKPIKNKAGGEDKIKSRRVEFRIRTNAEKRIVNILNAG